MGGHADIGPALVTTPTRDDLRSGIYEGTVLHHRLEPFDRQFSYRITMVCLDLSEVDQVCAAHPLWSVERANAVSFQRRDYLGDPSVPLDVAVRDKVEAQTGLRPSGPISMLSQLRTWGWLFNPITVYYCFDPLGRSVEATVVEVTNTPWHERTAYVLDGLGIHVVDKSLHVSPFLPMDLQHRFVLGEPGRKLVVGVDDLRDHRRIFSASMVLTRRPVDRATLGRMLWRFPVMTMRVSAGIYRQAAALYLRGAQVHPHQEPREATVGQRLEGASEQRA
jgi:uncharacterized protein